MNCPECGGRLFAREDSYECGSCGNEIVRSIVDNLESVKKYAESDLEGSQFAKVVLDHYGLIEG